MIIGSKFFGDIEINEEQIIFFEDGLFGFEDVKRFVILSIDGSDSLKCLQSVDRMEVAFIIVNPWDVYKDYEADIDDSELISLGSSDADDLLVYSIVTISEDNMTTNLIGPVIINIKMKLGRQVVLHNSGYTTKHIIKSFSRKD